MLPHNDAAYHRFLCVLRYTRLDCICCASRCCRSPKTVPLKVGAVSPSNTEATRPYRPTPLEAASAGDVELAATSARDQKVTVNVQSQDVDVHAESPGDVEFEEERTTTSEVERRQERDNEFIVA